MNNQLSNFDSSNKQLKAKQADLKTQLRSLKEEYDGLKVKAEVASGKLHDREQDLEAARKHLREAEHARRERSREASLRRREAEDLRAQLMQY